MRRIPSAGLRLTLLLAACLLPAAGLADPPPRYSAMLANGQRLQGNALTEWHDANAKPRLEGQPLLDAGNPLRWLYDRSLRAGEQPAALVEMHSGDRLPGQVVEYRSGEESAFDPLPPHLLVRPTIELSPPAKMATDTLRIALPMVRRIVWQRRTDSYQPGTVFYRDGRSLPFRAVRFRGDQLHLLVEGGSRFVPWNEIAELHLPAPDSVWQAYFDELAALCNTVDTRLMQVETVDGLVATTSLDRLKPRSEGREPEKWYHGVQPAWCLDTLWVPQRDIIYRRSFKPTEVPLSRILPSEVVSKAVLGGSSRRPQTNRSALGGPLRTAQADFGWGYGVQAHSELTFPLPPGVKSFRSLVALDRAAGKGGCIRARIFANQASGQPLWESPFLVGNATVADTGVLTLQGPAAGQKSLVLQIDAAHAGRPAGADPLEIRDHADWLDPLLELDPAMLKEEFARRLPTQFAAWKDWNVRLAPTSAAEPQIEWFTVRDERLPQPGAWRRAVATRSAAIVLSREAAIGPRDRWLVVAAFRPQGSKGTEPKLEVRIDNTPVAEFAVPEQPANRDDVRPLVVPLDGYQRPQTATAQIEIRQLVASADSAPVEWRAVQLVEQLPGLTRVFDEPADVALMQQGSGQGSGFDDDRHYGQQSTRLASGGTTRWKFAETIAVREQPKWGESRMLRFAVRKRGGGRVSLELETSPPRPEPIRYDLGSGEPTLGKATRVHGDMPDSWLVITRDVFGDFGPLDVSGITLHCPDGEQALVDHVYFGRTQQDFDLIPQAPSAEKTNQMARQQLMQQAIDRVAPAVVTIQLPDGRTIGGVVVRRAEGEILTVGHALGKPNQDVTVYFSDGKAAKGKTLGIWREGNIGLVRLEEKGEWPFPPMWPHEAFHLQDMYATLTLPEKAPPGTKPEVQVATVRRVFRNDVWVDADATSWTPGGALMHRDGYLMGLHTGRSRFGGMTFTRVVQPKLDAQIGRMRNGEVFGAWPAGYEPLLGVEGKPSKEGLAVEQVAKDSPAAAAGLQPGDLLKSVDGKAVLSEDDLRAALAEKDAGQEVTLDAMRAGASRQAKATLARR